MATRTGWALKGIFFPPTIMNTIGEPQLRHGVVRRLEVISVDPSVKGALGDSQALADLSACRVALEGDIEGCFLNVVDRGVIREAEVAHGIPVAPQIVVAGGARVRGEVRGPVACR